MGVYSVLLGGGFVVWDFFFGETVKIFCSESVNIVILKVGT